MKYQFQSHFADDIQAYVELRIRLGNAEDSFARRLYSFDAFCVEYYPDITTLMQSLVEAWCVLKPKEKERTLQLRTNILRGFAKYLNSIGKHAYVIPDGFVGKAAPYIPYLYTATELERFFFGADQLQPHPLSPYREYIVPVLFRTLYCCGLRPQEVRWLRRNDFNPAEGTLYITESKQGKDRIVAMSGDLRDLCLRYDTIMQSKMPEREFFFQNPNGGPFSAMWIQNQFFKCWKVADITFNQNHKPRVYSFRHNFATNVITGWMCAGKDVAPLLPYLSTYMGHSSLKYTSYYIHLIPEHLLSSGLTEWQCNQEVPDYED